MIDESDQLLTPQDVAKLLRVHLQTVYRWAADGRLPSVKVGGKAVRFRLADVRQVVQAGNGPDAGLTDGSRLGVGE